MADVLKHLYAGRDQAQGFSVASNISDFVLVSTHIVTDSCYKQGMCTSGGLLHSAFLITLTFDKMV